MKLLRCIAGLVAFGVMLQVSPAQTPAFTRPGTVYVVEVTGEVTAMAGGTSKEVKVDDRLRAEVMFRTGRRSDAVVQFSNGVTLKLGSESELTIDEFWQDPHAQSFKPEEATEEPSRSLTRLRLVSGDVTATVKPLKTARGSSFTLETVAGTLRTGDASFRARVQMTELGIGLCTLELQSGAGEFEPVGGNFAPMTAGRRLNYAVELDRVTGNVRLTDMPKGEAPKLN